MHIDWREGSLDPVDWESMKHMGNKMLDDMFNYLEHIEQEKIWKPINQKVLQELATPVPVEPMGLEQCYAEFCTTILKYHSPMNIHPGFWGWVMGCGNPVGVLAGIVTASLNANVIGGTQLACKIEEQVLAWFKELFGFPREASGVLTSGCSDANLLALAVARNSFANEIIKTKGLQHLKEKLVFYASSERHHSIDKAIALLGLGSEQLRLIPVDNQFRLRTDMLEQTIAVDRANGLHPLCIIGNVGSVNTGAIDQLERMAEIAKREGLWFHIDGAFGAFACLSEKHKSLVDGIRLADSLAFDLHKWMYMPYGIGCVLIKNREAHYRTFAAEADYIQHRDAWFSDYGISLSRRYSAIEIWMCLKAYGLKRLAALIERNMQQAEYLATLIQNQPDLELLAPVALNIVCFRYNPGRYDDETVNTLNKRIVMSLQFEGKVFPSDTSIGDKYAIRVAVTNYRSKEELFDLLVSRVLSLGDKLSH